MTSGIICDKCGKFQSEDQKYYNLNVHHSFNHELSKDYCKECYSKLVKYL